MVRWAGSRFACMANVLDMRGREVEGKIPSALYHSGSYYHRSI